MNDQRPRVLVLAGKGTDQQQVVAALSNQFVIDVFKDVDAAMAALRSGQVYHAIFADVGDFLPLERALVDQQASLVLNTIGEGVCVVDDTGRCVWANNRMRSFPPEVYDRVKQTCISARSLFSSQVSPQLSHEQPRLRSKKFGFQVGADRYYEAFVSPVINEGGRVKQVVAVVWDASSGRRLQQKIDAIDAAGRELVRLESEAMSKMNVAERLRLLEEKIIRYTSDLMHFDHFIIRLLNKKTNKLEPVISVGLSQEAIEVDLYAQPEGNGISGYVASTGRSYICHDVEKDPRYVPGLSHAKSSLTVPLRLHDKVIGIFNIESQDPGTFNEDDRQFAEIFGRYIAVALNILDLLVVERYTTSGHISENVIRELSGPLNDIVTEAQSLIEEYIGHDDLRQRLHKIVDYVEAIRKTAKDVTSGPQHVLGAQNFTAERDPIMSGKRVMVADDDENIRRTVASVLTKFGCQVFTAKDGHEAVNLIDSQPLDLVVSDIRMPHRNGYEIFAAMRRVSDTVPVILMTGFGYDPHHSIVRASQEGLQAVLFKPFKVDQLMTEVRKALGAPPAPQTPPSTPPADPKSEDTAPSSHPSAG
jgi:CheY-like chemotaxis protein